MTNSIEHPEIKDATDATDAKKTKYSKPTEKYKHIIVYKRMAISRAKNSEGFEYLRVAGMRLTPKAQNGLFTIDREASFNRKSDGAPVENTSAGPYSFRLSTTYDLEVGPAVFIYSDGLELPVKISQKNFKKLLLEASIDQGVIGPELYLTNEGWYSSSMIENNNKKKERMNEVHNQITSEYDKYIIPQEDLIPGQIYRTSLRVNVLKKEAKFTYCVHLGVFDIKGSKKYLNYFFKDWESGMAYRMGDRLDPLKLIANVIEKSWTHSKYNIHKDMIIAHIEASENKYILEPATNRRWSSVQPRTYLLDSEDPLSRNIFDSMTDKNIRIMYNRLSKPWFLFKQQVQPDDILCPDIDSILKAKKIRADEL